ncbi:MAG: hypothetical protein AAF340_17955 [Pseudomonadota bacterium]
MTNRNSGENTEGRNPDGTFAHGNPGKPKGARHRVTQAVESILAGQGKELTEKALEMALSGDTTALRLCIERIAPVRKDSPVEFDLPEMQSAEDATQAASAVIRAVSQAELTPLEGAALMGLIEQYRRTLETTQIEQRLAALEQSR